MLALLSALPPVYALAVYSRYAPADCSFLQTVNLSLCAVQEDYHLTEKLAQFDRERIPERVVHARGAAAKGFFEVTHDISHLSCADVFRAPGVQVWAVLLSTLLPHLTVCRSLYGPCLHLLLSADAFAVCTDGTVGVQTPLITRFSTVIHERGSPETLRDPRGFAVKFYTREGNWECVTSTSV